MLLEREIWNVVWFAFNFRFATVKYDKSNKSIRNTCMHLTNYSVNKKSSGLCEKRRSRCGGLWKQMDTWCFTSISSLTRPRYNRYGCVWIYQKLSLVFYYNLTISSLYANTMQEQEINVPSMSPFLRAAPLIFLTLHVNSTIGLHRIHFSTVRKQWCWRYV